MTADNASSILSAFKNERTTDAAQLLTEENGNETSDDDNFISDCAENQEAIASQIVSNDDMNSAFDAVIQQWSASYSLGAISMTRMSCLAHTLQLGIKDALSYSNDIVELIKKTNTIISWVHHSDQNVASLQSLSRLGLRKPNETRWNSTFLCLERLCTTSEPVDQTGGEQRVQ